jgi:phage protein D
VGKEKTVFKGEIHYIEPCFRYQGASTVVVGGYDHSHRLTRGTTSRTWGDGVNQQDLVPTAVRDVIDRAAEVGGTRDGLSASTVDAPRARSAYIPQLNVSDYHFMKWLGQDVDRSVEADTVQDDTQIHFRPPDLSKTPVKTLVRDAPRGEDECLVKEARFNLSTVRQVARVEVRGWDPKRKKSIVGVATEATHNFEGKQGWKSTGKGLYGSESAGKVLTITDRPVDSKEEADAIAKAIFTQLSMDYLTGEIDFTGDPVVTAGDIVAVRGFGKRFDGKYLITSCVHEMVPKTVGYVTHVKIARNVSGE